MRRNQGYQTRGMNSFTNSLPEEVQDHDLGRDKRKKSGKILEDKGLVLKIG